MYMIYFFSNYIILLPLYNVVLFSIFYAQFFFFSEKMGQILRLDNADAEDEEQIQVRLIDRMAIRYV